MGGGGEKESDVRRDKHKSVGVSELSRGHEEKRDVSEPVFPQWKPSL